LEHRQLLATVTTLVDVVANDGFTSLREAMDNATPGETIDFAASLNGGIIELDHKNDELTEAVGAEIGD
jgi:hypothetical protein